MGDTEVQDESIRIAHLTMLQGVITRMGANSFTLKALAATFGSAAVAVMATAETPSPYYAVAAVVPMIIFWLMDAQYLRLERAYRLCCTNRLMAWVSLSPDRLIPRLP